MTQRPQTRSGMSGAALVVCIAMLGAGVLLDAVSDAAPAFWIGAATGGGAALGAAAAVFAVAAGHVARLMVRVRVAPKEGGDANSDA
jgi:hypothetical protein